MSNLEQARHWHREARLCRREAWASGLWPLTVAAFAWYLVAVAVKRLEMGVAAIILLFSIALTLFGIDLVRSWWRLAKENDVRALRAEAAHNIEKQWADAQVCAERVLKA